MATVDAKGLDRAVYPSPKKKYFPTVLPETRDFTVVDNVFHFILTLIVSTVCTLQFEIAVAEMNSWIAMESSHT